MKMISINTNYGGLYATSLATLQGVMDKAMERLSTGKRINYAQDDAAGQAIATRLTAGSVLQWLQEMRRWSVHVEYCRRSFTRVT